MKGDCIISSIVKIACSIHVRKMKSYAGEIACLGNWRICRYACGGL